MVEIAMWLRVDLLATLLLQTYPVFYLSVLLLLLLLSLVSSLFFLFFLLLFSFASIVFLCNLVQQRHLPHGHVDCCSAVLSRRAAARFGDLASDPRGQSHGVSPHLESGPHPCPRRYPDAARARVQRVRHAGKVFRIISLQLSDG